MTCLSKFTLKGHDETECESRVGIPLLGRMNRLSQVGVREQLVLRALYTFKMGIILENKKIEEMALKAAEIHEPAMGQRQGGLTGYMLEFLPMFD